MYFGYTPCHHHPEINAAFHFSEKNLPVTVFSLKSRMDFHKKALQCLISCLCSTLPNVVCCLSKWLKGTGEQPEPTLLPQRHTCPADLEQNSAEPRALQSEALVQNEADRRKG